MIFRSHFISMIIYAGFTSIILSLIRKNKLKDRIRYGLFLFLIMTLGAILFGWFMYFFSF